MISDTARVYGTRIGLNTEIRDFAIVYENAELGDRVLVGEHSVVGRVPTISSMMRKEISHKLNTVILDDTILCANVIVYSNVCIGTGCLIGDNSSIFTDVMIGDHVLISRNITINSEVVIGNNTRIMDNSHITGRVKIGSNVFISAGVVMANDNFFGKLGYSKEMSGPVIEDFVSVGLGAMLLPNVHIGRGSIIASGSVVNTDIPENVVCGGNPAQVLRAVPKYLRRN